MNIKKSVKEAARLIFNKVTFLTIGINWGLIAATLYNRGYFNSPIHHETLLFNLVLMLNLPAIIFAESIQPIPITVANFSSDIILILIMSITIQWWIVGFFIKQIFFNRKIEILTDE